MSDERLMSLGDLAKELKINKSKLHYYVQLGLIEPKSVVGKTMIFSYNKAIKCLEYITKEKKSGKQLKEIISNKKQICV
jgi:DNA-binding transcriptional MerR regulator